MEHGERITDRIQPTDDESLPFRIADWVLLKNQFEDRKRCLKR